jgi:hypothetical protein
MVRANEIGAPRLKAFLKYWTGLRPKGGGVPLRGSFDVVTAPRRLVPYLALIDVVDGDGGPSFRYRVVGTGVVGAVGRDFTGETVAQYLTRHESAAVREGYLRILANPGPEHFRGTLRPVENDTVSYERLAAPLADDDGRVAQILACFDFARATSEAVG